MTCDQVNVGYVPGTVALVAKGRGAGAIDKVATGSYVLPMQTVGIKALKNNLSDYIRAAAGGETVLVTDRGRVVAEIGPARLSADAATPEQRLERLTRVGLVKAARRPLIGPPPSVPVAHFEELMKDLEADREDR